MAHGRFLGVIATGFVVGLCSVFTARGAVVPHPSATHPRGGWMSANANPKHAWLYVGGQNNATVGIYDMGKLGFPLIGTITQGLGQVEGLTIDGQGTLYVANVNTATVTIYPAGSVTPSLTLSQGLSRPYMAAVDGEVVSICGETAAVQRG
jgi:hypothetical protein